MPEGRDEKSRAREMMMILGDPREGVEMPSTDRAKWLGQSMLRK
jgi:hypothetical protein